MPHLFRSFKQDASFIQFDREQDASFNSESGFHELGALLI